MEIGSFLSEAIGRFLDLTTDEMKLSASNLANLDTPGYKTQGMNFSEAFSQAVQGIGSDVTMTPATSNVEGLVARADGNNVSMDRESLNLAKEQLQFRAGVEFLKHEYSSTMAAIHADSK